MSSFNKMDIDRSKFGKIISYEIETELKENNDLLNFMIPIGEIAPILVGIPGVPEPNPNIFQECNGSEITNENSPLRTIGDQIRYTPDLRDRYIFIPTNFSESGISGGLNNSWIFRHSHGGRTGEFYAPEKADSANDARRAKSSHSHSIDYSFNYPVNVEPPFYTVKWFMRIQ